MKLERRQNGRRLDQEIGQTELPLGDDGQIQRVPFSYVPETVGQYELRGRVVDAPVRN